MKHARVSVGLIAHHYKHCHHHRQTSPSRKTTINIHDTVEGTFYKRREVQQKDASSDSATKSLAAGLFLSFIMAGKPQLFLTTTK